MSNPLATAVLALVAGGIGAYAVTALDLAGGTKAGGPALAGDARGDPDVLERLDRLEARLDAGERGEIRLEGRGAAPARTGGAAGEGGAAAGLAEEVERVFEERIEPRMGDLVAQRLDEIEARRQAEREAQRKRKERRPLADVAREVGLSASEEDALRRIYDDSTNRMLELMAKPDGDVEQVKRDLEAFKGDPAARPKLMSKYVPKLMTNMGEIMAIEADKETRVRETLGEDRADLLDDYDIIEEQPFDLGGSMRVEASAGR